MERIQRNCRELKKVYKIEDVNSPKAASFRKKIFGLLRDAEREADGCEKGVELFWRTAYYEPIQAMKMRMYSDFMNHMIHIFIGEIIAFLLTPSRNVARYYIMLGDLMRYSQSPLATLEYRKAVEANPEIGKPFNQLAVQQKGIRAVRFFLLSLAAKESFKNAAENLKKSLVEQETNPPLLQRAMNIIQYMVFEIKRREMVVEFNKLAGIIEADGDEEYVQENLPMIVQSLVVAHAILPSRLPDDYYLIPIQLLADLFIMLLKKKPMTISQEVLVPGRRRRQLSSASSSEEEDEEEPSEKDDEIPALWYLSTCCQWLTHTQAYLAAIDKKVLVIPASVPEMLGALTDRLIDRLNDINRVLPIKNEECSVEEADWLLNGPALNSGETGLEAAQAQLSYWTDILTTTSETDVEFADYFRRRKPVDPSTLRKKIGLLHVDKAVIHQAAKKTEDNNWLPIYVILDYPVLERHLSAVRTLMGGGKTAVIPIVPLFVLGELDRMKSTGPGIRDAMRFIEKKQSGGQLRVIKGATHLEVAQVLATTADRGAEKISSDLVAILTTADNVNKYTDVVAYNIKSFMERWKRTNS